MCASEKVPEIPENDPLRVIVVPVSVRLKMPEPVRAPPPSCAPSRVAMKLCAEARYGSANTATKERSVFISVEGIDQLNDPLIETFGRVIRPAGHSSFNSP